MAGAETPCISAETPCMGAETPCMKICVVDPRSRLCVGCGRSLLEIERWPSLTSEERLRIMAMLPPRLEALRPKSPGPSGRT